MRIAMVCVSASLVVCQLSSATADSQVIGPDDTWCHRSLDNAAVCYEEAVRYAIGDGVPDNQALATSLFVAACEGGDGRGCQDAAVHYHSGRGVVVDDERAIEFATAACELGLGRGCGFAGDLFVFGRNVDRDLGRATVLFETGCEAGDAESCLLAGRQYSYGWGVAEDLELSETFYDMGCGIVEEMAPADRHSHGIGNYVLSSCSDGFDHAY